jgi:hypothetical protein
VHHTPDNDGLVEDLPEKIADINRMNQLAYPVNTPPPYNQSSGPLNPAPIGNGTYTSWPGGVDPSVNLYSGNPVPLSMQRGAGRKERRKERRKASRMVYRKASRKNRKASRKNSRKERRMVYRKASRKNSRKSCRKN